MDHHEIDLFRPLTIASLTTFPALTICYAGPHTFAKVTATQTAATALVLKADDDDGATTTDLTVNVTTSTTFGDVIDAINAISHSHGWYAGLKGARREDLAYNGASQVTWKALSATTVRGTEVDIYHDLTRAHIGTKFGVPIGVTNFGQGRADCGRAIRINDITLTILYTPANSLLQIYQCNEQFPIKTDALIWSGTAPASGVLTTTDIDDWSGKPLMGAKGNRLIVRVINDSAASVASAEINHDYIAEELGRPPQSHLSDC